MKKRFFTSVSALLLTLGLNAQTLIGEPTAFFAEFNTCDLVTGMPVDTSRRHKYAHQLNAKKDKKLIRNYTNPAYVLNGWTPKF